MRTAKAIVFAHLGPGVGDEAERLGVEALGRIGGCDPFVDDAGVWRAGDGHDEAQLALDLGGAGGVVGVLVGYPARVVAQGELGDVCWSGRGMEGEGGWEGEAFGEGHVHVAGSLVSCYGHLRLSDGRLIYGFLT